MGTTLDYILSEEEVANLPEPIRAQREAHIQALRDFNTEHPLVDGGESTEAFSAMIMSRVIMDAVTRRVLTLDEEDGDAG